MNVSLMFIFSGNFNSKLDYCLLLAVVSVFITRGVHEQKCKEMENLG